MLHERRYVTFLNTITFFLKAYCIRTALGVCSEMNLDQYFVHPLLIPRSVDLFELSG